MRALNLGIVAHVDAGKTSLTERLLHVAGVIDEVGSVDAGSTRTDTLALERERGITIRSAVVSFTVGDVTVNLVDTPGHPDFVAEVERVLGVLDGAVLVVSAVEGVQAQTRVLMRALRRLGIPTLVFVNKIDRAGARERAGRRRPGRGSRRQSSPSARSARRAPAPPPCTRTPVTTTCTRRGCWRSSRSTTTTCSRRGSTTCRSVSHQALRARLVDGTRRAQVHPVLLGVGRHRGRRRRAGAGSGRAAPDDAGRRRRASCPGRCSRSSAGRRGSGSPTCGCSRVRSTSGTVSTSRPAVAERVTALDVFADGGTERRDVVLAGEIARVSGLSHGPRSATPSGGRARRAARPSRRRCWRRSSTRSTRPEPATCTSR